MAKKNNTSKNKLLIIIIAIALAVVIIIAVILSLKKNGNIKTDLNKQPINPNFAFLTETESTLLENYDIYGDQLELTEKYLNNYKKGNYTVTNPYVVVNPYLISPQTALLFFKTDKKEKVTITIKGKHNDDLTVTFEASKDHYIPLYGLYGNYTNKVEIKTESGKKGTVDVKIDGYTDHGEIEVLTNQIGSSNDEFFFGTTALGTATLGIDNYGEVRWFLTRDYSKGMTMLQNGHMLISDVTVGPNALSSGGVIEVDMLGYIHKQYLIKGGYHHDAYELKNGNLLVTSGSEEYEPKTLTDVIYEIDRVTGKVVKKFDLNNILVSIDENIMEYGELNGAMPNSIYYDENRNEMLVSLRNKNAIIALDFDTQELKWILGTEKYWTKTFEKYFLKGIGNDYISPLGQHSISLNEDGDLLVFNNGYNANREMEKSCSVLKNNESYAIIYEINYEEKTAKVKYKFGGHEYFSYALGSFNYNKDGHKIFNSGWHFNSEDLYSDPNCTIFTNDQYDSYIIEFDENDNKILEMRINESKFEVIKAPIYNLEIVSVKPKEIKVKSNYEFNKDAKQVNDVKTQTYEKLTESEALAYKENEENPIEFFILNNVMNFEGLLLDPVELKVTLISPSGIAYRYLVKEAGKTEYNNVDLNELPKGRYYIYVNLDDSIYNTKQYVEI